MNRTHVLDRDNVRHESLEVEEFLAKRVRIQQSNVGRAIRSAASRRVRQAEEVS